MAAYVHGLDPFAIRFFDDVGIRCYGLAYMAGFIVAFFLIRRVLRAGASPLAPAQASDLVFALALGAVVGGRLGYVAFYEPSLLWTFSDEIPWWNALALNRGGMASHGGMIGVVVAAFIFAHRKRVPFLHVIDLASFAGPIGLFFGRVANFVNGELFGRPASDGLPWAVKFPQEALGWEADKVTTMNRALADAGVAAMRPADVIDAVQHGDATVTAAIAPLLTARHPSQLYEALLEGLLLFAVVAVTWRRPRKPGVVAAVFGGTYALVRIVGEQFRVPDAPLFSLDGFHVVLTRGQLLSVFLFVGALIVAVSAAWTRASRMGGWRRLAKTERRAALCEWTADRGRSPIDHGFATVRSQRQRRRVRRRAARWPATSRRVSAATARRGDGASRRIRARRASQAARRPGTRAHQP